MATAGCLLPGPTIYRPAPIGLREEDRRLFADAFQHTLPPQRVAIYNNVDVFGRGPLRADGRYLAESFASMAQYEQWRRQREHWRAAAERSFQFSKPFDQPAVWITDNWSCGYFHWVCDALPRLEAALAERRSSELTLLLPAKFRRAQYFLDSLQPFGLKSVRILKRFERLRCRELVFPCHLAPTGNYNESVMRALRRRFRPLIDTHGSAGLPERIYVSRQLATRRRIANESEIMPVLEKHGFEVVVAERLSWQHQVQLLSSARFLVSNHGAGLTNMFVMAAGSRVLEIREENDGHNNCYFALAAAAQLDYHYLLANRSQPDISVHLADLLVDPQRLDLALHRLLCAPAAAKSA